VLETPGGFGKGRRSDKEARSENPLLPMPQTWFSHLDAISRKFRPKATQK